MYMQTLDQVGAQSAVANGHHVAMKFDSVGVKDNIFIHQVQNRNCWFQILLKFVRAISKAFMGFDKISAVCSDLDVNRNNAAEADFLVFIKYNLEFVQRFVGQMIEAFLASSLAFCDICRYSERMKVNYERTFS